MSLLQGAGAGRCPICGTRHLHSRSTAGLCGDAVCEQVRVAREAAAAATARARRREERRGLLRAKGAAARPALTLPIVVLPGFEGSVADNEDRRAGFLETLMAEARQAFERPDAELAVADPRQDGLNPIDALPATVVARACALCGGHCCRTGGDDAYLTAEALRDIARENGITGCEDLVERYRPLIPELSYRDSCLFHGSDGCALPRALRSWTCKRYFCAGARELVEAASGGSAGVVLLATNVDDDPSTEPAIRSVVVVPFGP
ncbi:MAG: hypothetical protein MUF57_05385 [Gammaproteobacteria bacterium]|nr:hypothetical protein [Gammaproteobacteria bacterium]